MPKRIVNLLLPAVFACSTALASDLPFLPVDQGTQPQVVKTKAKKSTSKASAKNPYDVSESAFDLVPKSQTSFTLPRLGTTSGRTPVLNQNIIRFSGNDNEVVYVSYKMPNRISTPFKKPLIVDMSGSNFEVVGQDVFISPSKGDPIGVFIRESDGNGPVASLTLVPANIPGQNISLAFDGEAITKESITAGNAENKAQSGFIEEIRSTLAKVVNNEIPEGYTSSTLSVGTARIGNSLATPVRLLSGTNRDVFVYAVENIGSTRLELTEQSFYQTGVLGVTFWPVVKLEPKDRTFVFILASKMEAR